MWLVNGREIINLEKASKIIIGSVSLLICNSLENKNDYTEISLDGLDGNINILEGSEQVEDHIRNKITKIRTPTAE